jgi:hypothetical protein
MLPAPPSPPPSLSPASPHIYWYVLDPT